MIDNMLQQKYTQGLPMLSAMLLSSKLQNQTKRGNGVTLKDYFTGELNMYQATPKRNQR